MLVLVGIVVFRVRIFDYKTNDDINSKLEEICEGIKSGKYKSRTIKAEYELAQGLTKPPENSPEYTMKHFKFFDFKTRDDYGKDFYFTFLKGQKYSLIQVSFSVCEYSKWFELPQIQITMGGGKLFGVFVYFSKFGADIDFCGKTWWL